MSRSKPELGQENSERIKIPACAGMTESVYEKFKDLSTTVEMTDFFELKAIKRSFAALRMTAKEEFSLLHAIWSMLSGLGDDGRRPFDYAQDVKAFALHFTLPLPRGSTPSPILHQLVPNILREALVLTTSKL